jgi:dienelactone hydrolase
MGRISTFVVLLLVLAHGSGDAKPIKTLEDGKTGSIEFESLSFPPTAGAMSGLMVPDEAAKTVVTSAKLSIPAGTGRRPAVILMHGCSGVTKGSQEAWARDLGRMDVATLLVDSFDGRNVREICTGRTRISSLDYLADAYRALGLLVTHPRIDPARVAVMGFSLGGRTALWSSYTRFRTRFAGSDGPQFAAHLAFYPAVSWMKLLGDEDVTNRPVRIFQGAADDWTPASTMARYAERLRAAGRGNVTLLVYEGAYHGFDTQGVNTTRLPEAANLTRCLFIEQTDGRFIDSDSNVMSVTAPCASRGVSVGHHPQAHAKAIQDVKTFLSEVFGIR